MSYSHIARTLLFALFTLALSGCGAFMVKTQPDFEPNMRYSSDPIKVKVAQDSKGEFYLTDMEDDAIRRPWKVVGTFKALGPFFTSWAGAAREMGCDAFWVANEVTTVGNTTFLRSTEGTVHGVKIDSGDQLCILFTDDEAVAERESEINWVFTAYQRPPLNSGWNLANNISSDGGYTVALEKYLRHIPLGLSLRLGSAVGPSLDGFTSSALTWVTAGGMVMVPALNLWKLQLAPAAGLLYGISSVGPSGEKEAVSALIAIAGGYADLVIARYFALGVGMEYWLAMSDAPQTPDGLKFLFRYGFAF
ncbi:MAG: hypothetical protein H0U74_17790 [Bradymonadaceae bacterium]|nr:hypothetical protein [Lujinxingiaceae bacterium]